MPGKLLVKRVNIRFIKVRFCYPALQVVRHDCSRRTAKILKGTHMRGNPILPGLCHRGFAITVTAGPPACHEKLRLCPLTALTVVIPWLLPAVIHKQLFSAFMYHFHAHRQILAMVRILPVKTAPAKPFRTLLTIFFPQKLQSYMRTAHLLMNTLKIRRYLFVPLACGFRIQPCFKLTVPHFFRQRPFQTGPFESAQTVKYACF